MNTADTIREIEARRSKAWDMTMVGGVFNCAADDAVRDCDEMLPKLRQKLSREQLGIPEPVEPEPIKPELARSAAPVAPPVVDHNDPNYDVHKDYSPATVAMITIAVKVSAEYAEKKIAAAVAPLTAEIAVLLGRVAELEARKGAPSLTYRGVYEPETEYMTGDFATWSGSMWHAQRDGVINCRPGSDDHSWKLAVKRGSVRR